MESRYVFAIEQLEAAEKLILEAFPHSILDRKALINTFITARER